MTAQAHPSFSPDRATSEHAASLRVMFQEADKHLRQKLRSLLPAGEVEFAGVRLFVDPRDNYTDLRIWLDGQPPEMQSLMALIELVEGRRAFVLDVGANCGAYAVPLALAVGAGSRVVAVEPNPAMIGRLGHNVSLNQLGEVVRIEGCALGAEAGEGILNFRYDNYGQASLKPIAKRQRAGGTLVPIRPMSDLVDTVGTYDVSVLKIDVEGAEEEALSSMLRPDGWRPDAILMETRHAEEWDRDLVAEIGTLGYASQLEAEGNTLFVKDRAA